jgi:hypothetical protein
MVNTILTGGTGNYQTLLLMLMIIELRSFQMVHAVTANTYYSRINKA